MKEYSRAKAVVSLDAIAHNFEEMRKNISSDTKMIAVIKADGYGHGAAAIAHLIHDYDYIWGFATATAEEALQLRQNAVKKPILILGLVFQEYFQELIEQDIRLAVCDLETAKKAECGSLPSGKNRTYPSGTGYRNEPDRLRGYGRQYPADSKDPGTSQCRDRRNVYSFCES